MEITFVLDCSVLDLLFWKFDTEKDFLLVNDVILLAKYLIYKCKLFKVISSFINFKAKLKATYNLESYIAKEIDRNFTKSLQKMGFTFSFGCLDASVNIYRYT